MKKLISIGFLLALALLVMNVRFAHAATYTFIPSPSNLYDLEHGTAYSWGIHQSLGANEVITSAEIQLHNINDWVIEDNDSLYVHLLDNTANGVTSFTNKDPVKDYFQGQGTLLFTYHDTNDYTYKNSWGQTVSVNPAEDYVYDLDSSELTNLNNDIKDGNFGLGFDPHCHYDNDGITFKFCTITQPPCHHPVPEPASVSLFGMGLLGLLGLRKKQGSTK